MRTRLALLLIVVASTGFVLAQTTASATRERARIPYRLGWDYMKSEQYPAAVKQFQASIDIDPNYEYAHYGLGRAHLAMKRYVEAIAALERCKSIYTATAARRFTNIQEAQRYREDQILELNEQIRLQNTARPNARSQDQARQMAVVRENLEQTIQRDQGLTIDISVPPWVTLSLGSAYFRSGKMADAEREYKASIKADRKAGEAHNNLAVVYLETGRIDEAYASLQSAKKAGFNVNPQLEKAIVEKRR